MNRLPPNIQAVIATQAEVALGYGYTGARNDTTQQSGQTPDKEVEIVWLHLIRHACPDF
jgi:hypothetical protein